MHFRTVRVEGFDLHKFLTQCIHENISLYDIRFTGEIEMILRVNSPDWERFQKVAGNRYRITVLSERGIKPLYERLKLKKTMLLGIALFLFLIYYQSCFVSEIRIYGYEKLSEREIRENLKVAGLFEGCSKKTDPDEVELKMYLSLPDISWIGITYRGNLAEVTLVEGSHPIAVADKEKPGHIVAAKEGYVERVIAREGKEEVSQGQFVRVGDRLISGILTIEDKTYKRDPDGTGNLFRYVQAEGEVYARTIYRFTAYQEKFEVIKTVTGRDTLGIHLLIGDLSFNTADLFRPYDAAIYEEKELISLIRPIPFAIRINRQQEVTLKWKERDQKAIEDLGARQARSAISENISKEVQILNKSLKFYPEENIIRVIIMVEALEEIGKPQTFAVPEEGMETVGKFTN